MNTPFPSGTSPPSPRLSRRLTQACDDFVADWRAGRRPRIEEFLAGTVEPELTTWLGELLGRELGLRRADGEEPAVEAYAARFPDHLPVILEAFGQLTTPSVPASFDPETTRPFLGPPADNRPLATGSGRPVTDADSLGFTQAIPREGVDSRELPRSLSFGRGLDPARLRSRYTLYKLLGQGGYGKVYLARDEDLHRAVAIKLPRLDASCSARQVDLFLQEAQLAAGLNHSGIVRVYDVGRQEDGSIFIVLEYIDGRTLWELLRTGPLGHARAAALMTQLADAAHHAHKHGLVHRDLKPSNVLIDPDGKPLVTDFGLALHELARRHRAGEIAGTPAYMAPEQARGETHRLDGRTDVWGLGVILYEMLTRRQPFTGPARMAIFDAVLYSDPQPPRQIDATIPWELERICLNCLAKRMSDRYSSAAELADDLDHWLANQSAPDSPTLAATETVVPRGLRSFEAEDAGRFLDLLPGPRDRYALPISLKFWKSRVEETGSDETFTVGVWYGPSGSGKSSLLKAGLLPRLAPHVLPVCIDGTAPGLEARLLSALKRRCPDLAETSTLPEALTAIREGRGGPPGRKVLILIDQFEQWLHAHRRSDDNDLIRALRQCDGMLLQCLLLVRDDFWTAVSRFMRNLEVTLVEGKNCAAVGLFDADHARRVLTEFGRAFGRLPRDPKEITHDHGRFLDRAVHELAGDDGKIIPIRLCLFAEMMREKPWTTATFRALGGIGGIGVAFLEETFSGPGASPAFGPHQQAARAVLKSLLPEEGPDLKGGMRSRTELLRSAGYEAREAEFAELLQALDSELRLVTPIDPGDEPEVEGKTPTGERYYQLTHDYLVPSIRQWLTRKQSETVRGRAEILLTERAGLWGIRHDRRQLPSWWEFLSAACLTRSRAWTAPQRKMMRSAAGYHLVHGLILVAGLTILVGAGIEGLGRFKASTLHARLMEAETTDVPRIVREIGPYRRWVDDRLRAELSRPGATSRRKLHASLALLPVDRREAIYLRDRLLEAEPRDLLVIRESLGEHADALKGGLWAELKNAESSAERRLRAACGLARFDPWDSRWKAVAPDVVAKLCTEPPVILGRWVRALRQVQAELIPALEIVFGDENRPEERYVAACVLAEYLEDDVEALVAHALVADPRQLGALLPKLQDRGKQLVFRLTTELNKTWAEGEAEGVKDTLARRQANAAVVLLSVGEMEGVWTLLRSRPDPRLRSYLIHRFGPARVDPRTLTRRLGSELDPSIRQAIILALGEYREDALHSGARAALEHALLGHYQHDPDPGVHSAAGWLLRRWERDQALRKIDDRLSGQNPPGDRRWFLNGEGQTFAVVRAPTGAKVTIGTHTVRIPRRFALMTRDVTVAEFERFRPLDRLDRAAREGRDMPAAALTWYEAVAYCRWLDEQEEVPEPERCYPPLSEIGVGLRLGPGYLKRKGHRLPTESEWQYACQAGTTTPRPFGSGDQLLSHYAWCVNTANGHAWPSARLKPNDWGFFDILGNVYNWCHALPKALRERPAGESVEDEEDLAPVLAEEGREVARGGAFSSSLSLVYPWYRNPNDPANYSPTVGFRVARTCD